MEKDNKNSAGYTLRIPLNFTSVDELDSGKFIIDGKNFTLTGKGSEKILEVSTFKNNIEAFEYSKKLYGALLHFAVSKILSMKVDFQITEPLLMDEPVDLRDNPNFKEVYKDRSEPVICHGFYGLKEAVIYQNDKEFMGHGVGNISAVRKYKVDYISEGISDCFKLKSPESIIENEKLKLAIELFVNHYYESTERSKFLNLFTVIESLVNVQYESEEFIQEISDLKQFINNKFGNRHSENDKKLCQKIKSKLGRLTEKSITYSLINLVSTCSENIGMSEEEVSKFITDAYNLRSRLIHDGSANIQELKIKSNKLYKLVRAVLLQKIISVSN